MTPSMMEFFKACMRPDPLQRASAKDLLEMAFMREGAWEVRMGTTVSLAGFYDLMQRAFAKDLLEMAFMREGAWEVRMGITVSFGGFSNRLRIVKKKYVWEMAFVRKGAWEGAHEGISFNLGVLKVECTDNSFLRQF